MVNFKTNVATILELDYNKTIKTANRQELYNAISKATMKIVNDLCDSRKSNEKDKKIAFISAEFLIGRLLYNNLVNLGLLNQYNEIMTENGKNTKMFEDMDDPALGEGYIGRLAACYLDSGATNNIELNGYGIKYQYGLFKQYFENGFQAEIADDWQKNSDSWFVRKENEKVRVVFKGQIIYAVPYDTPVIGYGAKKINNLRLWQSEAIDNFDFKLFNDYKYDKALKEKNDAEIICKVLYPNDSTDIGKQLKLKQQYFFVSASLKDMIRKYKQKFNNDFSKILCEYAIHINDTYPIIAIPEFIRIMVDEEGLTFAKSLKMCKELFSYTSYSVKDDESDKWDIHLVKAVIPNVYKYIVLINKTLIKELKTRNIEECVWDRHLIIEDNKIHMVRLAVYVSRSTSGVSSIYTEKLKNDILCNWYKLYPYRFNNKSGGITQRRWLLNANPELAGFITDKIGNGWITNLDKLEELAIYFNDKSSIYDFGNIKDIKKRQLANYIYKRDNIKINPEFIFDIQVKKVCESKRQLLNAFSILDIYYGLKDGRINKKEFNPIVFIFGGKATPDNIREKGIIKYINEISNMISSDDEVKDILQVVFISNYDVSYAEKIMPAADIFEKISTVGEELYETGSLKAMLNGAVVISSNDEINADNMKHMSKDNNYFFGVYAKEINRIVNYEPEVIYSNEPRVKNVMDTLVDGTFDDEGTGVFKELYDSILGGIIVEQPDKEYLVLDFISYCDTKIRINKEYSDEYEFRRRCFKNITGAGAFSSDRTIREYYLDVWMAD